MVINPRDRLRGVWIQYWASVAFLKRLESKEETLLGVLLCPVPLAAPERTSLALLQHLWHEPRKGQGELGARLRASRWAIACS